MEFKQIIDVIDRGLDLKKLDKKLVIKFLKKAKELFKKEPQLVKLDGKYLVCVGDTHGDYKSSQKVVEKYAGDDIVIVFLGDYVDRSPERYGDIRNVLYLFYKKMLGNNIILLRGNHDDPTTNNRFDFLGNVCDIWDSEVWTAFNDVFLQMPLAAVTEDVIMVHGGLPEIEGLEEINTVPKGLTSRENVILDQVMWNDGFDDPAKIIFEYNRGVRNAIVYGTPFFDEMMKKLNKIALIRGHDNKVKGWIFNNRCLTLITSTHYQDRPKETTPFLKGILKSIDGCIIALVPPKINSPSEIIVKDIYQI